MAVNSEAEDEERAAERDQLRKRAGGELSYVSVSERQIAPAKDNPIIPGPSLPTFQKLDEVIPEPQQVIGHAAPLQPITSTALPPQPDGKKSEASRSVRSLSNINATAGEEQPEPGPSHAAAQGSVRVRDTEPRTENDGVIVNQKRMADDLLEHYGVPRGRMRKIGVTEFFYEA